MVHTSATKCSSMKLMPTLYDDVFIMCPSDLIGWDNIGAKGVRLGQKVLGEPVFDYYLSIFFIVTFPDSSQDTIL